METQKMISISDASRILAKSERHVRRLASVGKLDAVKDGKAYLTTLDSVLAFLENERSNGPDADMEDDDTDMSESDVRTAPDMSANDVRNDTDMSAGNGDPTDGNGHPSAFQDEVSEDALDVLDLTDRDILDLVAKCSQTLDDSIGQVKTVLTMLADGFTTERGRTRETKSTLNTLLDHLETPSH